MESKQQAAIYEIRIQGYLDARRAQQFAGMEIVQAPGGVTSLTGPLVDQAALYGLLSRIRDLGIPLIAVTRLDDTHGRNRERSA